MAARAGLIDTFLGAAARLGAPPEDSRMKEVGLFQKVRIDQMFCAPPGCLGGRGVTQVEDTGAVLRSRKFSRLEGGSIVFQLDLLRGRIPDDDERLQLHREIQRLCEGVCFAQMHPLRLLFLKANHLLSVIEARPEFKGKKLVPITPIGRRVGSLPPIQLSELRRYLALFVYHVESHLKEGDEDIFKLGELYFYFLFNQLEILQNEFRSEEMDQFIAILTCIRRCLEKREQLFPLLLQPLGSTKFTKEQIDMRMISWTRRATEEFAANVRSYCGLFESKFRIIKKRARAAALTKAEVRELETSYLPKIKALRDLAEATYRSFELGRVEHLMRAFERNPHDSSVVDELVAVLDVNMVAVRELTDAFSQFHTETRELVEGAAIKLASLFYDDPCDLLVALCHNHNASIWYPFHYMLIVGGGSLFKAGEYWRELREKRRALARQSLFSDPTLHLESEHVRTYQVVLHDLKRLVVRIHESVPQGDRQFVYTLFSHLVTLEVVFKEIELNRGKPGFDEAFRALELYQRFDGHLAEFHQLASRIRNGPAAEPIAEAIRVLETMQNSMVIKAPIPSLDALYLYLAVEGREVELTLATLAFFREVIQMSLWSLREWNKRPICVVGDTPFFAYLTPAARAHLNGYFLRIEANTILLRGLYFHLASGLSVIELNGPDALMQIADLLQRSEELVSFLGIDEIFEEIMEECHRYLEEIRDDEQKGRAQQEFKRFQADMRTFTDDSLTFKADIYDPNRPLLACARYLWLIADDARRKDGGGARTAGAAERRRSPIVWHEMKREVGPLQKPKVVDAVASVAAPLSLPEALLRFDGFIFYLKNHGHNHDALGHMEEYIHCLRGLATLSDESANIPYAFTEGLSFYSALFVEQLVKFLLSHDGLERELQPLLFSHRIDALLEALESRRPDLREVLTGAERRFLIDLGHLIVRESRHVWNVRTDVAESLRHVASLSSELQIGTSEDVDSILAQLQVERRRAVGQAEEMFGIVFKLVEGCGFSIGQRDAIGEEVVVAECLLPGGLLEDQGEMERLHLCLGDLRLESRRLGSNGQGLEMRQSASTDVLQRRRRTKTRCIEEAKYHATFLQETTGVVSSIASCYPLTMMTLNKCSLLLETSLKALLAYFDIPADVPEGHVLWQRDPHMQRVVMHDHRLHHLFLLLRAHLEKSPLSGEEEAVLRTLNDFIGLSFRYLVTQRGEEGLTGQLKMLAFLTRIYPDAQRGLYGEESRRELRRLFSDVEESDWRGKIEEEIARIESEEIAPLVARGLQVAMRLFSFQKKQG